MEVTAPPPPAPKITLGNEKLCKITEKASVKLTSLLTRQGRPNGALRLAVIGGGCSGLQYKMDLVDGPANRDILVRTCNVNVVMDPKSARFVSGSLKLSPQEQWAEAVGLVTLKPPIVPAVKASAPDDFLLFRFFRQLKES